MLRVHVKNGIVTAIDLGDTINKGIGREDAYITQDAINKSMIQARNSCSMGRSWRKDLYNPNRVIYPMKRVGARGEGKFARITWDEAISTVANNFKQIKDKYGPYSAYLGPAEFYSAGFTQYFGMGFIGVGNASQGAVVEGDGWLYGTNAWAGGFSSGNDIIDVYQNSKLVILWGQSYIAKVTNATMYYLALMKEKGIPVIVIQPNYTMDAEVYGAQWIPIRTGTDSALGLALANVLFKENLVDQAFASNWLEPTGLQKYKDYVLGNSDDMVDKTPEWAETITGVPADTTRQLARLWARSKPVACRRGGSMARRQFGEDNGRILDMVQLLTGNAGIPGATLGAAGSGNGPARVPTTSVDWKKATPTYTPPEVCAAPKGYSGLFFLTQQYNNGQLSKDDFYKLIGNKPGNPAPNVQIIHFKSNRVNNNEDMNQLMRACQVAQFTLMQTAYFPSDSPTMPFCDIVLPETITEFEGNKSFSGGGALCNTFMRSQRSINPAGECRPREWVEQQIANQLGVGAAYSAVFTNVTWDNWSSTLDGLEQQTYVTWAARSEVAPLNPPSWTDFNKNPIVRAPLTSPLYYSFYDSIAGGKGFPTDSGKIEIYSKYLATATPPPSGKYLKTHYYLNSYGTAVAPMPKWAWYFKNGNPSIGSMWDPDVTTGYPLTLYTSHSNYRQHSLHDGNPWLRDEYRHSVWISVADAKARGIVDNDLVMVLSPLGQSVLPAYVTARTTPGTVLIWHGGWYTRSNATTTLMPNGLDTRGAINFHFRDVYPHCLTMNSNGLVQVQKF